MLSLYYLDFLFIIGRCKTNKTSVSFPGSDGEVGCKLGGRRTHQGSNSWMMLSKRMTAKSLELKPASQARNRMVKDSRDCQPAGCDRPPGCPPSPAAAPSLSATAVLLRPFPEHEAAEFSEDRYLLSDAG